MRFIFAALVAITYTTAGFAKSPQPQESESLYYAVEKNSHPERKFEIRGAFGYDISNPYLNVLGGQLSGYYLINKFFAAGVEIAANTTAQKEYAKELENELKRHNYRLDMFAPDYGIVAVGRFVPLSGLVNLFSNSVIKTELGILLRGGSMHYKTLGFGPTVGTGFDVTFEFNTGFGMHTSLVWDWDKPSNDWLNRTSFRVGPSFRF